jgi:hypothetical protein
MPILVIFEQKALELRIKRKLKPEKLLLFRKVCVKYAFTFCSARH